MSKSINFKDVLSKIVRIWAFCFGAITLQIVAGYYLSHLLLPYLGFALILGIIAYGNYNLKNSEVNCSMMTHYAVYTLALAGFIMLVANLLNTNFITNKYSEFSHQNYPFHTVFIVYPVGTLMFGMALLRRGKPYYCNACRTIATQSISESLRRNVLHHEAKLQLRLSFGICLGMTILCYLYYYFYYRSNGVGRRYSPDVFFMYILPAAIYGIALVYMIMRYASLEFEVSLKMAHAENTRTSKIRYMVVWRDKLLLKDVTADNTPVSFWDTPAEKSIKNQEDVPDHQATIIFRQMFGHDMFSLRRLFSTNTKDTTTYHYAAFIDDEFDCEDGLMDGTWFTLREVDLMLKEGIISRAFAIEIHRVFTITMAWKTYTRDGKRLYPIKNYRPTFRLRDFKTWDVDYEDMHWLSVSQNNEDKPLYNLRRLYRKYVNGIDNRWTREKS